MASTTRSTNAEAPAPAREPARRAPVTDRVNGEPAILNGMAATEAYWIGAAATVVNLVLAILILLATGLWQPLLILPLLGTGLILWYASLYLAKVKRGRPEGYYTHAIQIWMAKRGLGRTRFIQHTGYWSLGRMLAFGLTSSLTVGSRARASGMKVRGDAE